eukprot:6461649-Amphidinium_carterae.1
MPLQDNPEGGSTLTNGGDGEHSNSHSDVSDAEDVVGSQVSVASISSSSSSVGEEGEEEEELQNLLDESYMNLFAEDPEDEHVEHAEIAEPVPTLDASEEIATGMASGSGDCAMPDAGLEHQPETEIEAHMEGVPPLVAPAGSVGSRHPAPYIVRTPADATLHLPQGRITYYNSGFFTCQCKAPGHGKCVVTRTCKGSTSLLKTAQGRPLGF